MSLVPMMVLQHGVYKMELPKATMIKDLSEGTLMAEVYARPVLCNLNGRYLRFHPSGRTDDLTEKYARVAALVSQIDPRQMEIGDAKSANDKARK